MKNIWIVLCALIVTLSAGAQKKKELSTLVNVNYCLPKVVYNVEVTMECTHYIPGPYRNYAEKELGLKPEITRSEEHWTISKVDIKPQYIPDERAVYSISATNEYTPIMLTLSAEGFLAGVAGGIGNNFNGAKQMKYVNDEEADGDKIDIIKLNTYNHLKEVLDTNYTYQQVDGEMKKIWDPIVRYAPKTESDNVKEAVSEIFRIRSERVKLLGAENNVPDGKSLEIILKEFDQMEANYLSLFMGKKEVRKVKRVVTCVPEKAEEPFVAFRFSESEGITDSKNVSASAYFLKVANVIVPASNPVAGESTASAVYYRVPAIGELQLLKGKEAVMSFRAIVPQLGEVKRFPVDVIANEGMILEFYPEYGALKSVRRK